VTPADYTEGMPSKVRLIAIDIDGTLLPTTGTTISRRNCRALREAQAAGLHIVIATGRRHQYAVPVLEQVGLSPRTVMISSNGSVVRHFDGELIRSTLLPVESARALCPVLRPFGQTMVLTFDRERPPSLVVESMASLHQRIGVWVEANRDDMVQIAPLERAFDHGEAPIQAMLCGNIEQVRAAEEAVEGMELGADITMHRTEYAERDLGILDLLPPGCSKGHALADYARSLGLDASEVMAIGDNFNDQAMLEYAGQAILMGNAGEEMQALPARHDWAMTLSNDEDGVAETLEPLIRSALHAQSAIRHAGNPDTEVVTSEHGIASR
jgi:Cof subfamily protein (haloacid dehalogenase superfamily)